MEAQTTPRSSRGAVAAALVATTAFFAGIALLVDWAVSLGYGL